MTGPSELVRALGGDVVGRDCACVPGPGHSPRDRSLSVRFTDSDFLVYSHAGDDWRECREHVQQALNLPRWQPSKPLRRHAATRTSVADQRPSSPATPNPDRLAVARHLARRSWPAAGTVVERYLREARGYDGPIPPTIRFLAPTGEHHSPAMLALFGLPAEPEPGKIHLPTDRITGVYLTALEADGSGRLHRKMIGRSGGSPIVLAPIGDSLGLAICEGIESGLSVHAATGLGVWSAGSASRLPGLADAVPSYVDCTTVAVEDDPAGRHHAVELADRLRRRGLHVEPRHCGGQT
jgi:hypothetical protein